MTSEWLLNQSQGQCLILQGLEKLVEQARSPDPWYWGKIRSKTPDDSTQWFQEHYRWRVQTGIRRCIYSVVKLLEHTCGSTACISASLAGMWRLSLPEWMTLEFETHLIGWVFLWVDDCNQGKKGTLEYPSIFLYHLICTGVAGIPPIPAVLGRGRSTPWTSCQFRVYRGTNEREN